MAAERKWFVFIGEGGMAQGFPCRPLYHRLRVSVYHYTGLLVYAVRCLSIYLYVWLGFPSGLPRTRRYQRLYLHTMQLRTLFPRDPPIFSYFLGFPTPPGLSEQFFDLSVFPCVVIWLGKSSFNIS